MGTLIRHIHVNIAPNGNDTWGTTKFVLVIDFQNPNSTQTISWDGFRLSEDKRDIDFYFKYDGKNLVPSINLITGLKLSIHEIFFLIFPLRSAFFLLGQQCIHTVKDSSMVVSGSSSGSGMICFMN